MFTCRANIPGHDLERPATLRYGVFFNGLDCIVHSIDSLAVGDVQVFLGHLQQQECRPPRSEICILSKALSVLRVCPFGLRVGSSGAWSNGVIDVLQEVCAALCRARTVGWMPPTIDA